MAKRILVFSILAFFIVSWMFLCVSNFNLTSKLSSGFGPRDVARRLTSPDGRKTAILVRSYASFMDLNFILYITDNEFVNINDPSNDVMFYSAEGEWVSAEKNAGYELWYSGDYEPTTFRNWKEEVEWSKDSSVIAVIIEDQYTFTYDYRFAYDFGTDRSYEETQQIIDLLAKH